MRSYLYPANFTTAEEGGFVVTFPDVPEAMTQGGTPSECIEQAVDALEEAIIARINMGANLPLPSDHEPGQFLIPVPAQTAFKAALYEEIKSQSLSKIQLAKRLGVDEKEVRRLLDPHHSSKLPRIAEFLNGWESTLSLACRTIRQFMSAVDVPPHMRSIADTPQTLHTRISNQQSQTIPDGPCQSGESWQPQQWQSERAWPGNNGNGVIPGPLWPDRL